MITKITNGKIITENKIISGKNIYIKDGKILYITEKNMDFDCTINAKNNYVSSGFIDLHCHGGAGYEFIDGTKEAIEKACKIHLFGGTTTIYPTLSAYDFKNTENALKSIEKHKNDFTVNIPGVHLEGPYFSPEQSGAQLTEYIKNPDKNEYEKIYSGYKDLIKRWSYAPELTGAEEFLKFLLKNKIVPSMGHTNAKFPEIKQDYEKGCKLVTHLYSCTSSITRENGFRILGVNECAYLFDDMYVEAIADGCHLPKELLKLIYKLKGSDKICLVTDSIRFGGMKSVTDTKKYPYTIENGVAKLKDKNAFAGSIATANILVKNCLKADIPIETAVKMITEVPAKIMGLKTKGKIKENYDADIIIFDKNINITHIIAKGTIVKKPPKE